MVHFKCFHAHDGVLEYDGPSCSDFEAQEVFLFGFFELKSRKFERMTSVSLTVFILALLFVSSFAEDDHDHDHEHDLEDLEGLTYEYGHCDEWISFDGVFDFEEGELLINVTYSEEDDDHDHDHDDDDDHDHKRASEYTLTTFLGHLLYNGADKGNYTLHGSISQHICSDEMGGEVYKHDDSVDDGEAENEIHVEVEFDEEGHASAYTINEFLIDGTKAKSMVFFDEENGDVKVLCCDLDFGPIMYIEHNETEAPTSDGARVGAFFVASAFAAALLVL